MPGGDPVVAEFVGLPASGKSTLAERVRSHLRGEDATVAGDRRVTTSADYRDGALGVASHAVWPVAAGLRSPVRALAGLRDIGATNQSGAARVTRYWLYHLYLTAERRRLAGDEIHLADQGILQHVWRMHLTGGVEDMQPLRRLLGRHARLVSPDVVVFVDVAHRRRMAWARQRGDDVDDELLDPDHPLINDDRCSYRDMKAFVPTLWPDTSGSTAVVEVENDPDATAANVAEIAGAITRAIEGTAADPSPRSISAVPGSSP